MINSRNTKVTSKRFAHLILDIGTFLMASGAHCGRIDSNIRRMAEKWGFHIDMQLTFKGLLVSVKNLSYPADSITLYKQAPSYNVHLQIITEVSRLSWRVVENDLSIEETEIEFSRIRKIPDYKPMMVSFAVGIACAGLCIFSMGDIYNAITTFIAAFTGSIIRYKIAAMEFNPMISIAIAAFVTTFITGCGSLLGIGSNPQAAMATAVLYLIPGVPLINCVIDLIEGYLSSAMNRALFSGFILLCIAVGMTLSITLMGINNF